jgi:hypothetical protein
MPFKRFCAIRITQSYLQVKFNFTFMLKALNPGHLPIFATMALWKIQASTPGTSCKPSGLAPNPPTARRELIPVTVTSLITKRPLIIKQPMKFKISDSSKTEALACAYILSAYESCGHTTGMGFLQARPDTQLSDIPRLCHITESPHISPDCKTIRADYVAGRMVKTNIDYDSSVGMVTISDNSPKPDYQGWSTGVPSDPGVLRSFDPNAAHRKFSSHEQLLQYAANRVGVTITCV